MKKQVKTRGEEILEQIAKISVIKTTNLMEYMIPRGKSIIVERRPDLESQETKTKDGLIIQTNNEGVKANIGIIVAVGAEVPEDLRIGSVIYFNQFANLEVLIGGKSYLKMHETDAYFIINPEGKINYLQTQKVADLDTKFKKNQEGLKENARVKKISENDNSKRKPTKKVIYHILK